MIEKLVEVRQFERPNKEGFNRFCSKSSVGRGLRFLAAVGLVMLFLAPGVVGITQANSSEIATAVTAESLVPDTNTPVIYKEVGDLTAEPILQVFNRSLRDPIQFERWDVGSVGSEIVEFGPQYFVRAQGYNFPQNALLKTEIIVTGPAKVCAYDYPETQTCKEVKAGPDNKDVSYYLFDTGVLDPIKRTYIQAQSTRVRVQGPGEISFIMTLTDDTGMGLIASANTDIKLLSPQKYIPYVSKGDRFSLN